jgi:DNA polymerase III delta subunit
MGIRDFLEHLERGFKAPSYVLYSADQYLLKESLLEVSNTIPEAERDFCFHTFDLDFPDEAAPVERIIDVLNTVPFLGGRQVVAVENSQKMNEEDIGRIAGYLGRPSPDSVLFLLNTGTLKKTHREKLKGARFIAVDIKERDLPFWVTEKAARKGIKLTSEAVEYLIGTIGPDAGLLSSEIEKLSLTGKEKPGKDDIAEIIRGIGDCDAFDLINALRAKDTEKVLKIYKTLSETQEPYGLLGALNWHYGRVADGLENRVEVFSLLNDADTMLKSSGGIYPLEHLLLRLLRL